jgi:RNA polymerase sigma-70 factor, ECF subfamily
MRGGFQKSRCGVEPDNELLERCRRNEERAWTQLVRKDTRDVFGLCLRATGYEEKAQDLTQEIFLKIFRAIGGFDGRRASFTTWLYRVARNHLVDYYRFSKKHRLTVSIDEESLRLEQDHCREPSPPDRLERSERQALLQKALEQLPPGLREAVALRDLQGLEYTEVSRMLGIPSGTAKSRIHRGRLELGRVLGARQEGLAPGASALSY